MAIDPDLFARLRITGIAERSDRVRPGDLFVAVKGLREDGLRFAAAAIERGARAILVSRDSLLPPLPEEVAVLRGDHPRLSLSRLLKIFYAQPEVTVAVTGTNGKTSTVHFIQRMAQVLNKRAACLGTLGVTADLENPPRGLSSLTTLPAVELHQNLDALSRQGIDYLAIEASSHGLEQYRLDGVELNAAGLTQITRGEHTDYHPTFQAYCQAKAALFARVLSEESTAVLNSKSLFFPELKRLCEKRGHRVMTYGRDRTADLHLKKSVPFPIGQRLTIVLNGVAVSATLPLRGEFQALNALCGFGLVMATEKMSPEESLERLPVLLSSLEEVPGRLNWIGAYNQASIYVDYAHTPHALKTALISLRAYTDKRLFVVFGCGGDRDQSKRASMGRIASAYADRVIVTDDNPRTEDPARIRRAILTYAGANAIEIGDRKQALLQTLETLESGDVLLVAGKGDESVQIVQDVSLPFHDPTILRQAIENTP